MSVTGLFQETHRLGKLYGIKQNDHPFIRQVGADCVEGLYGMVLNIVGAPMLVDTRSDIQKKAQRNEEERSIILLFISGYADLIVPLHVAVLQRLGKSMSSNSPGQAFDNYINLTYEFDIKKPTPFQSATQYPTCIGTPSKHSTHAITVVSAYRSCRIHPFQGIVHSFLWGIDPPTYLGCD